MRPSTSTASELLRVDKAESMYMKQKAKQPAQGGGFRVLEVVLAIVEVVLAIIEVVLAIIEVVLAIIEVVLAKQPAQGGGFRV